MENQVKTAQRLPHWMKMKRAEGPEYSRIKNLVTTHNLNTICKSGNCPNIGECWNRGTATFMILGNICTRHCRFCAVPAGKPLAVDPEEPCRLAEAIKIMGIRHCVITSVDRDDLEDLGASAWASTVRLIKETNPGVTMEVLIPDFQGRKELIQNIIAEMPEIISHNLETVERLTGKMRSRARYETSLDVLRYIASSGTTTKSGIMLGLGETNEEVLQTMDDMIEAGVQVMTLGQYLQPTASHMSVMEYIAPDTFEKYKEAGIKKGFKIVESSPLVRSSYFSEKHVTVASLRNTETLNT
ncbi:MAG: lipoyl synthase [Bacteroidales bacterium]|nr:lipoyl synthase [Bacteroidales bacterium]